jgi:hypothetical protein
MLLELGKSMKFLNYLLVSLFILIYSDPNFSRLSAKELPSSVQLTIDTIHGSLTITDPLVIELIQSPAMQRLKKIRQYGSNDYIIPTPKPYSRYEHCLGVYFILNKVGVSRQEQIAGLLHDVSHTVFSHATDLLFLNSFLKGSYQDIIHRTFLLRFGLAEILTRYGLTVDDVLPDRPEFRALEQKKPALCADRIEYNIFAGYMDHGWTLADIQEIHAALRFDGQDWYFDSAEIARKFAEVPLYQTTHRWGGPENYCICRWTSNALERAMTLGLITKEDILFNITDDKMWERLISADDEVIQQNLKKILNIKKEMVVADADNYDQHVKSKFSGVDPLVKTSAGLKPLTEIDAEFKAKYLKTKTIMEKGWYLKWRQ